MSQTTAGETTPACLDLLRDQVISPGICVACGACVGLCPHLLFFDGRVAAPDPCTLTKGRCVDLCPQFDKPGEKSRRQGLFKALSLSGEGALGPKLGIWQGRASSEKVREKAQYGGVVTTLLTLALESGLVGEAIVTGSGPRQSPQGASVKSPAGLSEFSGSIYAAGGTLARLNQALAGEEAHSLAVVGLPCQSQAAAAMAAHPEYPAAKRIGLTIGLFCTMNLDSRGLRDLLAAHGVEGPVSRADFPPPPAGIMQVWAGSGYHELPLEEVYQARLAGCALCGDLTAELSDISVGAAEGREGFNTIIARSQKGLDLLTQAREKGLLTMEEMPTDSLAHLQGAAEAKRERAAAAIKEAQK